MWGISILADFRPMGISFDAVVVFGLSKIHLFKSVLGHCDPYVSRYRVSHNYLDWAKYQNRHSSKSI